MCLNAELEHRSRSCIHVVIYFFMLLIQWERFLISDVTWLCNCDSFRRRPAQRNNKNLCTLHGSQMLRDNDSFHSRSVHWLWVRSESWIHPLTCVRRCYCCFPSDSLNEETAEWGQRKRRRVFGTDPTGRWPRLSFLLSFSFHLYIYIYIFIYYSSICSI